MLILAFPTQLQFFLCDNNISCFIFLYILSSQKKTIFLYNKRTSNTKMKQIILFTVSLLIAISTQAVETEKEFILILNSTLANGTWDKDFNKELQDHCHKRSNLYLDSYTLSFPSADTEKDSKEQCARILQKYASNRPKAVVIIGAMGWHITSHLFETTWKDIPVILCHPLATLPNSL